MKKFIKKITAALLLAALLTGALTACSAASAPDADSGGRLSIVTTIFPEYDWVREIMGDRAEEAEITLLLDNGADLHNYQPTADDIIKISTCDMFVYVGGESDKWTEDALKESANPDMVTVNLLEALGDAAKTEEAVEGMETEDEDGEELDEHVWLSLKNAEVLCGRIAEELCALDGDNAGTYEANAQAYITRLEELDGAYQSAVDAAGTKTLLFGDRFPFRYLADDYGLDYYAAFSGCSAETEASFETVAFLAGKVDGLGLQCVMTIEGSDNKIAETIIDNTEEKDQRVLALDSMQSVTAADVENGASYLSIMMENLDVLRQALA